LQLQRLPTAWPASLRSGPQPMPRHARQAYRVIKPGGLACLIGPVHPTFWLSRFFADVWMLFPTEDEYMEVGPPGPRGDLRHC